MPLVQCTSCGQRLDVEIELASTQIECPTCTAMVSVPAEQNYAPFTEASSALAHSRPLSNPLLLNKAAAPLPLPASASKKSAATSRLLVGGGMLALIALVVAGAFNMGFIRKAAGSLFSQEEVGIEEELKQAQQVFVDVLSRIDAGESPSFRFSPITELNSAEDLYRKWMYDYLNDVIEYSLEYSADMKLADTKNILKPERLAADKGFVDTYRNLGRIKLANARLHEKMLKRNTVFRTGKMDADVPAEWKEELEALNAKSTGEAMARKATEWEYENRLLSHMSAIISLLDHQRDYWQVKDGVFIFNDYKDLMEYNRLMQEMGNTLQAFHEVKGQHKE